MSTTIQAGAICSHNPLANEFTADLGWAIARCASHRMSFDEFKGHAAKAAAAPDLLAIAHAVQRAINAHDCEHPHFLDSCADVCQMLDEMAGDVRKAIDKAEGRERAKRKEVAGR